MSFNINLSSGSGTTKVGSITPAAFSSDGILTINNNTTSTSTTSGSLIISGGVGIAGTLYTGTGTNLATISGITTIGSSTAATVSAAGVLTVANTTKIGSSNTFTGTGGGINTDGDITLSNATSNIIAFRDVGVGEPIFTTRNAGTKIVLRPRIGAASVDNAIGVSTLGDTWFSVPDDTNGFIWYNGETPIMQLSGSGGSGLIIGGGIITIDTTDAISASVGGAFTSAGGGAFEKKLFVGGDTNLATMSGITTIGSSTAATVSAAGVLTVVNTTASTTTTTGALKVAGGVGIAGALYANSGNFTTLTAPHSGLSGLLNDEHTQYTLLAGRSGGQIITGGTAASNLLTLRSTSNATKGRVHIDETTTSTSTVSGALTVAGGVGIGGVLYTGIDTNLATISGITTIGSTTPATISAAGVLTVANTTTSTSITTGALIVSGGVGIADDLYVGTGANIATVSGITTIGSTTPTTISAAGILTIANSTSIGSATTLTGTGGSVNINGDVTLYNATKNTIAFRNAGFAAPTLSTRSNGTKIVLFGGLTGSAVDYALGVESNGFWSSVSAAGDNFHWYGAATRVMTLTGGGNLNTNGTTASTTNATGSLRTAGGIATSNTTDAVSSTNGGTFTSAGGGAFAKKLFIGTDLSVGGNAVITGSISKGSGTFNIEHPLDKSKRLIHSFVEGPRCDNIYRGEVTLIGGTAQVNLDRDCVADQDCRMTEGTFQALNKNISYFLQNKTSFEPVIGKIEKNILTIRCAKIERGTVVSWMVIGERQDTYIQNWIGTNKRGHLITEL